MNSDKVTHKRAALFTTHCIV